MNIQHLRYFLTLTEWKNYRIAAEKLFISQPGLSKAIKSLEEELGVPLFNRVGNENLLSKYGKIFYTTAKKCVEDLDHGIGTIETLSHEAQNLIRLGSIYSCSTQCVPLSMIEFQKQFPGVLFDCTQGESEQIIEALMNQEIDVGLISTPDLPSEADNIGIIKILSYSSALAVPNDHKFSDLDSIRYANILDEPFVAHSENSALSKMIRQTISSYGYDLPKDIRARYNTESAILSSISKGLGIGLVSDTDFNRQLGLRLLKLEDVFIEFPVYMIWRDDLVATTVVNAYKNYVFQAHHLYSLSRDIKDMPIAAS